MQARDIERHLTQLGQELTDRGIQKPIRVLMIGGAYMLLLAKMQRSTDDVDILSGTRLLERGRLAPSPE